MSFDPTMDSSPAFMYSSDLQYSQNEPYETSRNQDPWEQYNSYPSSAGIQGIFGNDRNIPINEVDQSSAFVNSQYPELVSPSDLFRRDVGFSSDLSMTNSFSNVGSQSGWEVERRFDPHDYSQDDWMTGIEHGHSPRAAIKLEPRNGSMRLASTMDGEPPASSSGDDRTPGSSRGGSPAPRSGKPNDKPYSYLIQKALRQQARYCMTLTELYHWFGVNNNKDSPTVRGTQNSIRHNLSMNEAFEKRMVEGVSVWALTEEYIHKPVQPTTRFRRKAARSGSSSSGKSKRAGAPTPKKQASGAKGGQTTSRLAKLKAQDRLMKGRKGYSDADAADVRSPSSGQRNADGDSSSRDSSIFSDGDRKLRSRGYCRQVLRHEEEAGGSSSRPGKIHGKIGFSNEADRRGQTGSGSSPRLPRSLQSSDGANTVNVQGKASVARSSNARSNLRARTCRAVPEDASAAVVASPADDVVGTGERRTTRSSAGATVVGVEPPYYELRSRDRRYGCTDSRDGGKMENSEGSSSSAAQGLLHLWNEDTACLGSFADGGSSAAYAQPIDEHAMLLGSEAATPMDLDGRYPTVASQHLDGNYGRYSLGEHDMDMVGKSAALPPGSVAPRLSHTSQGGFSSTQYGGHQRERQMYVDDQQQHHMFQQGYPQQSSLWYHTQYGGDQSIVHSDQLDDGFLTGFVGDSASAASQ